MPALDEKARVGTGADRYIQREVRRYVRLNDDTDEFGYVTSDIARAIGVEPAPIRLPEGRHNVQTDKGFGEVHIQARHGSQLANAGYPDVAQFTLEVVKGFDSIYEGHGGALILVKQGACNEMAVLGLRPFGTKDDLNWEVTTAAIYNQKFFKNKKKLWSRPGPANSPPEGESPFKSEASPRSQSQSNIAETGQDFNPARVAKSSLGAIEDAAVLGNQVGLPRQSVVDPPKQDAPLGVRGEEPALIIPKSDALTEAPDGTFGPLAARSNEPSPSATLTRAENQRRTPITSKSDGQPSVRSDGRTLDTSLASFGEAETMGYRVNFFRRYPDLEGEDVWVHHAVEQRWARNDPQTIIWSKMHSAENLRGIPKIKNNDVHLKGIAREMNRFRRQYPNPTEEQLLAHANYIDDMFGEHFLPPRGRR